MLGVMILINQIMNVGATTFFALSGGTHSVKRFILYQIIGGLCGLGINLTYAGMVRFSSVETAAAIGTGLSFVSVQIFSSYLFSRRLQRLAMVGSVSSGSWYSLDSSGKDLTAVSSAVGGNGRVEGAVAPS